jgi:hypothetical protein
MYNRHGAAKEKLKSTDKKKKHERAARCGGDSRSTKLAAPDPK